MRDILLPIWALSIGVFTLLPVIVIPLVLCFEKKWIHACKAISLVSYYFAFVLLYDMVGGMIFILTM